MHACKMRCYSTLTSEEAWREAQIEAKLKALVAGTGQGFGNEWSAREDSK